MNEERAGNAKVAEMEIERFVKDFVKPLEDETDSIRRKENSEKMFKDFHSSTFSILSDVDSGAFSRVSSDEDSDFSDSLVSVEVNDERILKDFSKSILSKVCHKLETCKEKVTVNGLCVHCESIKINRNILK